MSLNIHYYLHLCFPWLLCVIYVMLSKHDTFFSNTRFDDLSRSWIPELIMNILSCHIFEINYKETVAFTWYGRLVDYYLSKGFMVIDSDASGLNQIPNHVQYQNNYVNKTSQWQNYYLQDTNYFHFKHIEQDFHSKIFI